MLAFILEHFWLKLAILSPSKAISLANMSSGEGISN